MLEFKLEVLPLRNSPRWSKKLHEKSFKSGLKNKSKMKKTTILHFLSDSFIFNGSIGNLFIRCSVILKVGPSSWSYYPLQYFISCTSKGAFTYLQYVFSFNFRNFNYSFLLLAVFSAFRAVFCVLIFYMFSGYYARQKTIKKKQKKNKLICFR